MCVCIGCNASCDTACDQVQSVHLTTAKVHNSHHHIEELCCFQPKLRFSKFHLNMDLYPEDGDFVSTLCCLECLTGYLFSCLERRQYYAGSCLHSRIRCMPNEANPAAHCQHQSNGITCSEVRTLTLKRVQLMQVFESIRTCLKLAELLAKES